jgi:uncharacterized protein (DUF952 family)
VSELLFHVTRADDLEASRGEAFYAPQAYAHEGFVHLCRPGQLVGVLARHFPPDPSASPRVLLELERARLGALLEDVPLAAVGESFPRLHGPVPWAAILRRTILFREPQAPLRQIDVASGDLRISHRVHANHVLRVVSGRLTNDDLVRCHERLWRHPDHHFDRPELHEYLDVDARPLTSAAVSRLAESRADHFRGRKLHRVAIVASDPLMFGFARMFSMLGGGHDDLVAVVDRFDAAFAWLELDGRPPEAQGSGP